MKTDVIYFNGRKDYMTLHKTGYFVGDIEIMIHKSKYQYEFSLIPVILQIYSLKMQKIKLKQQNF